MPIATVTKMEKLRVVGKTPFAQRKTYTLAFKNNPQTFH